MPLDVVLARETIELLPQVRVLDRLAVSGFPAVLLPCVDPVLDALFHILRVGIDRDRAAPLEAFKRANHRGKLHAIIGRVGLAAKELALGAFAAQERSPSAGTGVSLAGSIGVDDYRRAVAGDSIRQARATPWLAGRPMQAPFSVRAATTPA